MINSDKNMVSEYFKDKYSEGVKSVLGLFLFFVVIFSMGFISDVEAVSFNNEFIHTDLTSFEWCFDNPFEEDKVLYKEDFNLYTDNLGSLVTYGKLYAITPVIERVQECDRPELDCTEIDYYAFSNNSLSVKNNKTMKCDVLAPVCREVIKNYTEYYDLSETDFFLSSQNRLCYKGKRRAKIGYDNKVDMNFIYNNYISKLPTEPLEVWDTKDFGKMWWNTTWNKQHAIILSNIPDLGGDINYPVKIILNDSNINLSLVQSDCGDVRFTDESASESLDYFIEICDTDNFILAHVNATFSNSTNNTIYVFYDTSENVSSLSNVTNTFGNSLEAFWSFNSGTTDLTGNGWDGTLVGSDINIISDNTYKGYNGSVDIERDLPGIPYMRVNDGFMPYGTNEYTFLFRTKTENMPTFGVGMGVTTGFNDGFSFDTVNTPAFQQEKIGHSAICSTPQANDGKYHSLSFRGDNSGMYNNVDDTYTSCGGNQNLIDPSTTYAFIGALSNGGSPEHDYDGILDEIKIYHDYKSDDFISVYTFNESYYTVGESIDLITSPNDIDFAIVNTSYNEISTIGQEEFFINRVLWSNGGLGNLTNSDGNCSYSIDFIGEPLLNMNSNVTICSNGCDYSTRTISFDDLHTEHPYNEDVVNFLLCHNGGIYRDFTINNNCGYSNEFDSASIVGCDEGYTDLRIDFDTCGNETNVTFDIVSDGVVPSQALRLVDDYVLFIRNINDTNEPLTYNSSNDYWYSDEHVFLTHGQKNISINCNSIYGFSNETTFYVTSVNRPPQLVVSNINDWFNGDQNFAPGVEVYYPLQEDISITGGCLDDDISFFQAILYDYNNNMIFQINTTGINLTGESIFIGVANITQGVFNSTKNYLNGTYPYYWVSTCIDTEGNFTLDNRTFYATNEEPTANWDVSNFSTTTTENIVFTCSDRENETLNSFVSNNGVLDSSQIPTSSNYFFNESIDGLYNLSLVCQDSFFNSSIDVIGVSYFEDCDLSVLGLEDGGRYNNNIIENIVLSCSNNITLNNCYYSINEFSMVVIDNCSNFDFYSEVGHNNINFYTNVGFVNENSFEYNLWSKKYDSTIFEYVLIWVLVFLILLFYVLGVKLGMGILYLIGGCIGIYLGFNLMIFSMTFGITLTVLFPIVSIILMYNQ